MTFAEKILELRVQNGYSQEFLAEKLGVSRQAVSKWELGITLPETDKLVAISDLFNVSIDYLLKEKIQSVHNEEDLDRLVLRFLGSAQDMDSASKELVDIMRDGVIDDEERGRIDAVIEMLDGISSIIDEIREKVHI